MSLLRNNSFILALALIAGISLGQGASYTRDFITPLLAVIMTLSLVGVSSDVFKGGRKLLKPAGVALLLNYGLLAGAFIGLSYLLIDDPHVRSGYVLIAAVPPAVAVIPFTYKLGGDVSFTLVGSVAGHVAAFFMTPLITLAVLGSSLIEPGQLVLALLQLIAAPFAISRLLRMSPGVVNWLNRYRGTLVNWGFFVVVYTIIGLNRSAFWGFSQEMLAVAFVSALCTFGVAFGTYGFAKLAQVPAPTRVSYSVIAAWKNYGLAGAIALLYFGEAAALPAAVTTAFAIANFIVLSTTIAVRD